MRTKVFITLCAATIALVHAIWPQLKIDYVTLVLIVIAALPWLHPLVKGVELPGGFKIELQDVKAATETLQPTGTAPQFETPKIAQSERYESVLAPLREVAHIDARLALVGLRVEIEQRLREISAGRGLEPARKSAGRILRELLAQQVVHPEIGIGLEELIRLGNEAAHGATVSPDAAAWALDHASFALAVLDRWAGDDGDV